jgi:predicted metalloprotease with PDZ domain
LYRPDENTANSTVSYYSKGALLALALDLTLRTLPDSNHDASDANKATLAGVMRRLWALQRPIDEADVAQALQDEAGAPPTGHADWQSLLSHWVHGTDDLPLQSLLQQMGVQWALAPASLSQRLGVRLKETPQGLQVSAVMRGSPAEAAGVAAGDELLALDGWRLKRPDDWQTLMGSPSLKPLLVSRDQRILSLVLPILDKAPTAWCQVVNLSLPEATGPSLKLRKGWLGC